MVELFLTLLIAALGWVAFAALRSQKRGKGSGMVLAAGLAMMAVLDPAKKPMIEMLDKRQQRKEEAGRENE